MPRVVVGQRGELFGEGSQLVVVFDVVAPPQWKGVLAPSAPAYVRAIAAIESESCPPLAAVTSISLRIVGEPQEAPQRGRMLSSTKAPLYK